MVYCNNKPKIITIPIKIKSKFYPKFIAAHAPIPHKQRIPNPCPRSLADALSRPIAQRCQYKPSGTSEAIFSEKKKWRNEKRERPRFTRVPNCEGRFDKSKVDYCFERQFVIEERVHVICMVIWMVIWDFSS